ncbi:MAG TPA: helix-turn-helix domain-containing GNAT family N-acetyltransferase [Pilimelia sp.]|nr:helix-turn-helix domain-containing GNAT family N-acetyltransferase [Pilimelia sp.]
MSSAVAEVREFNRFYTGVIGLLQERLLCTAYSLTEARVIFELAQSDSVEVADLRRALDLDAGYLSRLLARFDADGLVSRGRAPGDARRQVVALTDAGRAAWRTLDSRSTEEIGELLCRLGETDQRRLLGAMATIQDLLGGRPNPRRDLVLRAPGPGELGWIVQRHGDLYAREYGWDATFEGLVAGIVRDFAAGHDPRREAAWIAEVDGNPVGSVMCVREDETTARLRVLLVEPSARGTGIGGRLVTECVRFAQRVGYSRMTLLTYDVLADARRVYERSGFTLDRQRPARAYGHDLVEQQWSRDL